MDQEPCDAVINDLRNRTTGISDNRGAACHCLDHDQAKRLRPINREKKSRSISQEIIFLRIPNFARELYQWIVQSRLNAGLKILLVGPVDFGRNPERHSDKLRNLDGFVQPFFRRDPPQERKVFASAGPEG